MPTLSAFWGDRVVSRDRVAEDLSRFLGLIQDLDERLTGWRAKASSRRNAAAREAIALTAQELGGRLRMQKADLGGALRPELGYSFAAWNGGAGGEDVAVSCTVGLHAGNPNLRNSVVLDLPRDLAQPEPQGALLACLREVWKPDEVALFDGTPRQRTVLWPSQ